MWASRSTETAEPAEDHMLSLRGPRAPGWLRHRLETPIQFPNQNAFGWAETPIHSHPI